MDIRIASYRPNAFTGATVTASRGTPLGQATVQNAAGSSPVAPIAATQATTSGQAMGRVAGGDTGGYTDSVRGSLVNILA